MLLLDEIRRVPLTELENHMQRFRQKMDELNPGWKMVAINHKVAMYYFTGTIQDGVLIIRPEDATLWVRRLYERAAKESEFADIRPMHSFREVAAAYGDIPDEIYVEKKRATLDWLDMLNKYFQFKEVGSIDKALVEIRKIKTPFEIGLMKESGKIHEYVLDVFAPTIIREGISETELAISLYKQMVAMGSHGTARFNMAMGEEAVGIAAFGKSGLVKTAFDGPGGTNGTCIAMPSIGRAARMLREHQTVYLDIPCGVEGYHTDKTSVYYYGDITNNPEGQKILDAQRYCTEMEVYAASIMKPGVVIEDVYIKTMEKFGEKYGECFMNGAKFLGHSIGLVMDEAPAIAKSFKEELVPGMTFALEPKIGLPGIGMVGRENTYVITENGSTALTCQNPEERMDLQIIK